MDAQRPGDPLATRMCSASFRGGGVEVGLRRAGELELAAGLERDAAERASLRSPIGLSSSIKGLPAGARRDAVEQGADAVVAFVGDGPQRIGVEDVLFVLGADAPFALRLCRRATWPRSGRRAIR